MSQSSENGTNGSGPNGTGGSYRSHDSNGFQFFPPHNANSLSALFIAHPRAVIDPERLEYSFRDILRVISNHYPLGAAEIAVRLSDTISRSRTFHANDAYCKLKSEEYKAQQKEADDAIRDLQSTWKSEQADRDEILTDLADQLASNQSEIARTQANLDAIADPPLPSRQSPQTDQADDKPSAATPEPEVVDEYEIRLDATIADWEIRDADAKLRRRSEIAKLEHTWAQRTLNIDHRMPTIAAFAAALGLRADIDIYSREYKRSRLCGILAFGPIFGLSVGCVTHLFDPGFAMQFPQKSWLPLIGFPLLGILAFTMIASVLFRMASLASDMVHTWITSLISGGPLQKIHRNHAIYACIALIIVGLGIVVSEVTLESNGVLTAASQANEYSDTPTPLKGFIVYLVVLIISVPFATLCAVAGWNNGRKDTCHQFVQGCRDIQRHIILHEAMEREPPEVPDVADERSTIHDERSAANQATENTAAGSAAEDEDKDAASIKSETVDAGPETTDQKAAPAGEPIDDDQEKRRLDERRQLQTKLGQLQGTEKRIFTEIDVVNQRSKTALKLHEQILAHTLESDKARRAQIATDVKATTDRAYQDYEASYKELLSTLKSVESEFNRRTKGGLLTRFGKYFRSAEYDEHNKRSQASFHFVNPGSGEKSHQGNSKASSSESQAGQTDDTRGAQ